MNLKIIRYTPSYDGVFGELSTGDGKSFGVTLEHAFSDTLDQGPFWAKVKDGTYTCKRGEHQLHNSPKFITFEVTGVEGHQGILFHVGNYNKDSEGCILLGRRIVHNPDAEGRMITSSKNTFNKFMDLQKNVDEFTLTVVTQV